MNIQTEFIENHSVRVAVEVEAARLDRAKEQAARRISRQVSIPGFRKGKAPYHIVANYVGEQAIIEEALESLGDEIYRDVLAQSDIKPYGPASLEDFTLEPELKFVYVVALLPEVDLKDYRSVRLEYKAPEVTDEEVEITLKQIQRQFAELEEHEGVAEMGNIATIDVYSEFVDGEEWEDDDDDDDDDDEEWEDDDDDDEEWEGDDDDDDDEEWEDDDDDDEEEEWEDDDDEPYKGDVFIREDHFDFLLDEENVAILPGFSHHLIGVERGADLEFEMEIPDEEDYKKIAGRKVKFRVHMHEIKDMILPELNDEFATRVMGSEDDPKTLVELRADIRKNLEDQIRKNVESDYAEQVLSKIVEQAEFRYPDKLVEQRIEDMMDNFDVSLRRQKLSLDDYLKIAGINREDLAERYRDSAEDSIRHMLALREILAAEKIQLEDDAVDKKVDEILAGLGKSARVFRRYVNTSQYREDLTNDLLYQRAMELLVKIGKGEEIGEAGSSDSDVELPEDGNETDTVDRAITDSVGDAEEDITEGVESAVDDRATGSEN